MKAMWRLRGSLLEAPRAKSPTLKEQVCEKCGRKFYQRHTAKYCRECRCS